MNLCYGKMVIRIVSLIIDKMVLLSRNYLFFISSQMALKLIKRKSFLISLYRGGNALQQDTSLSQGTILTHTHSGVILSSSYLPPRLFLEGGMKPQNPGGNPQGHR